MPATQVHASAQSLKLCAFDADGTLYADGHHIEHDNQMVSLIVSLMRSGVYVAIVTAAGYPGEADRFEQRIEGLVNAFRRLRLPQVITDRSSNVSGQLCTTCLPGTCMPFVNCASHKSSLTGRQSSPCWPCTTWLLPAGACALSSGPPPSHH